jgi:hypothetical protein
MFVSALVIGLSAIEFASARKGRELDQGMEFPRYHVGIPLGVSGDVLELQRLLLKSLFLLLAGQ